MEPQDAKRRFSSRVQQYVRARPGYPRQVLDVLARELGFNPAWMVADVGSGTGISTKLFLDHGNEVFAVEPNDDMRQAAERLLKDYEKFHSVSGSAEATTLPDNSVDLVVAAQSFHWFERDDARREFARIGRPRGALLLMWNDRELTGTPFLQEYEQLLIRYGTDYLKVRHDKLAEESIARFFGPGGYQHVTLPNAQTLDWEGLSDRVFSSSYTPLPSQPGYEPMLRGLRELFDRHQSQGIVTLKYRTQMYTGRLSP